MPAVTGRAGCRRPRQRGSGRGSVPGRPRDRRLLRQISQWLFWKPDTHRDTFSLFPRSGVPSRWKSGGCEHLHGPGGRPPARRSASGREERLVAHDSAPSTSTTLLLRLRQDPADQASWVEFVRRYGPEVYRWCRRWELQEADAEDVTQAVLVRLCARMRTFAHDPARSFRAYLK